MRFKIGDLEKWSWDFDMCNSDILDGFGIRGLGILGNMGVGIFVSGVWALRFADLEFCAVRSMISKLTTN